MSVDLDRLEALRAHAQTAETGDKYLATWEYETVVMENIDAMIAELKHHRLWKELSQRPPEIGENM
jgi:hypothetical protein